MLIKKQDLLNKIHLEIEEIVYQHDLSYLDAILKYTEDNDLEFEHVGKLIKQHVALKQKLQEECENLNLVEKTNRLILT